MAGSGGMCNWVWGSEGREWGSVWMVVGECVTGSGGVRVYMVVVECVAYSWGVSVWEWRSV